MKNGERTSWRYCSTPEDIIHYRKMSIARKMLLVDDKLVLGDQNGLSPNLMLSWGTALSSVGVTYPLNKIATRQCLWGFNFWAAVRQLRIEGTRCFFRGIGPAMLIESTRANVFFKVYHKTNHELLANINSNLLSTLFAANVSGSVEAVALTPLERVQVILQDGRNNNLYRNMFDTIYQLRRYGWREYYRGFTPSLLRKSLATFVFFNFKDDFKELITPVNRDMEDGGDHSLEMGRYFAVGGVLGAVISTLFYPLIVMRIQMQACPVGTEFGSIRQTAAKLWVDRVGNIGALLAGARVNAFRSFLYWGCINICNEGFKGWIQ